MKASAAVVAVAASDFDSTAAGAVGSALGCDIGVHCCCSVIEAGHGVAWLK